MADTEALHHRLLAALDGPARPVLADEAGAWTNRDLLSAASRWRAGVLRAAPEDHRPVAILGAKSCNAVAAIIGALCAGRPFSTFDPVERACRVRARLEALRPSAIIDLEGLAEAWSLSGISPVLPPFAQLEEDHGLPCFDAQGLAYVLFTSGSTGAPRGIGVGHRAAVLARDAWLTAADLRPGDVIANDIPLIFDVATLDVLGGVAGGGFVRLIPLEATETEGALAERLTECGATHGFTVPTVADLLTAEGPLPPTLRRLFLTGEKIGERLAQRLAQGKVDIVNAYGMTEAPWIATGRLGHGLNVFDLPGAATPVQVTLAPDGEVMLSGPGLHSVILDGQGAPKRDPGPVASYASGDFARALPGGRFELLGRRDRHVRFEGFRIELGEIESAVEAATPEVLAYAAWEEASGRLTVSLAPRDGAASLDLASLRARAERRLPAFLSRLHWRLMDVAPRTVTGKKNHVEAARQLSGV